MARRKTLINTYTLYVPQHFSSHMTGDFSDGAILISENRYSTILYIHILFKSEVYHFNIYVGT